MRLPFIIYWPPNGGFEAPKNQALEGFTQAQECSTLKQIFIADFRVILTSSILRPHKANPNHESVALNSNPPKVDPKMSTDTWKKWINPPQSSDAPYAPFVQQFQTSLRRGRGSSESDLSIESRLAKSSLPTLWSLCFFDVVSENPKTFLSLLK